MSSSEPTLLVTGAAGGLGATVTARLLAGGARVVACDRSEAHLQSLKARLEHTDRLHTLTCDLSDAAAVRDLFDQVGSWSGAISGVAHLVGGYHGGTSVDETSDEIWDGMLRLNLRAAFLVMREAIRFMKPRSAGSIVVISSAASLTGAVSGGTAAYAASKAGLNALVEAAAAENRTQGIRVNAVLPALIRTEANEKAMPDAPHDLWVSPLEVAETVRFLLSPAASGITGSLIKVTGRL